MKKAIDNSKFLCRYNSLNYVSKIPFVYYIKPENLRAEYENIKKLPQGSVIVIIDHPFSSVCCSPYNYNNFLDLPNIELCISENWNDKPHPKLSLWPIGLESRMIVNKQTLLHSVETVDYGEKTKNILCNSHFATYPRAASGYRDDRRDMINQLINFSDIDFWKTKKSQEETFKVTPQYHMSLCPEGNGLDTHRFYETYLLGCRPIVRKGPLTPLHSQFPNTIVVNDWKDVENADYSVPSEENDYEMVRLHYWLYKYFRNKCRLLTFFTGGISEEWKNLLYTIREQGLEDLLVVFVLDEEAKKCVESENKNGKITMRTDFINELGDLRESEFLTKEFRDIMVYKIKSVCKLLEENNIIFYLDTDIVLRKNIVKDFFKYDYKEIYFQADDPNFNFNSVCAGVMFIQPTENMKKLFYSVLEKTKHRKVGTLDDQGVINDFMKSGILNREWYGVLSLEDYPNGPRYFGSPNAANENIQLIHNNWIVGNRKKEQRFKEHNLWFV